MGYIVCVRGRCARSASRSGVFLTYASPVADHFSSFFLGTQVVRFDALGGRADAVTMIVNLSAQYVQRFEPMERPSHRQDVGERTKFWAGGICYDVHPLALWILCAAFHHAEGRGKSLYHYHQNNARASFGSYSTGTPLSRALMQARRCMGDTREGWGNFRDADPMVQALAEVDGWVPTEAELIALRRGRWSWGFDWARFCPDLPAPDGWGGKSGTML